MACIFSCLNPVIATVVAIIIGVFYYFKRWNHINKLIRNIPGPPTDPLFGNVDSFNDAVSFSEVNHIIYRTFDKYGSIFKLWLAHEIWICISDNKLAKDVITQWNSYAAVPSFNFFGYSKEKDFVTESCMGLRKEYCGVLVKPKLQENTLTEANTALVSSLKSKASKKPITVEDIRSGIYEAMRQIYYDATWNLKTKRTVINKIHKPIQDRIDLSLLKAFQKIRKSVSDQTFLNHGVDPGVMKMTIAPYGEPEIEKPQNEMRDLNISFDEQRDPQWKSAVCEHVSKLISKSAEDTSLFVCNLLHDMAANPATIAAIREEVEAVRLSKGVECLTLANEEKLKYTEMVVKEGLRHYAPPGMFYRAGKNIQYNDKTIPEGILVYICTSFIHMDHKYYRHPVLFYPEHFTEEAEKARSEAYYPLPLDPEGCEDKRFVMKILKLMLAHLVMNFNFESMTKPDQINHDYFLIKENLKNMSLICKPLRD